LNYRLFNIIFIVFVLGWIWADRHLKLGPAMYGLLLIVYLAVLFCGSYFIRWGFFFKSICFHKTSEKVVSLSFDDGPDTKNTGRILDILKENKTEAVFFCIGKRIAGQEGLLNRMIEEGHIVGNHSYSHHPLFDLFSPRKMLAELNATSLAIKNVTGYSPRFFRPPYGVTNPNLRKALIQGRFISVGWSLRSYDTAIRNEDRLFTKVNRALKPGAIILFHDTSETMLAILPRLLNSIKTAGYKPVRLDKMINLNPYA
jgi:peptidoglycan/xylan/chitin deacetylase (PgdA/CDA1 family)